jgi:hypothetical protein
VGHNFQYIHNTSEMPKYYLHDTSMIHLLYIGNTYAVHHIQSVHTQYKYITDTLKIHWQYINLFTQMLFFTVFCTLFGPPQQPSVSGLEHGV